MTLRIGVIGTGMIGHDHIRRITDVTAGAQVVAVADVETDRAADVAKGLAACRVFDDGEALIASEGVDAVLVASWGPTHEQYVLASIAAGKDVFCEKPLTPTPDGSLRIVHAEVAHVGAGGRRLVQVGFMRRYDPGYRQIKAALDRGELGAPLIVHSAHRNPAVPPYGFTTAEMASDSAVHDIDVARFLLGEEITGIRVLLPRRSRHAGEDLNDTMLILMETASGAVVDAELYVNCQYGYDIRCEVVCESGTVSLGGTSSAVQCAGGQRAERIPADWRERFAGAYDSEVQHWVDAVSRPGTSGPTGPTAWDGHAAATVAQAALTSLTSGDRIPIDVGVAPAIYRSGSL